MYLDLHTHERDATEIWRPITSDIDHRWEIMEDGDDDKPWPYWPCYVFAEPSPVRMDCPYGAPGDVLACREGWAETADGGGVPIIAYRSGGAQAIGADGDQRAGTWRQFLCGPYECEFTKPRWRKASTMPDWAIRKHVTVRQVEVRRVNAISFEECRAAGCDPGYIEHGKPCERCDGDDPCDGTHRGEKWHFSRWWDSAFPAHPWAGDPWCWRVVVE